MSNISVSGPPSHASLFCREQFVPIVHYEWLFKLPAVREEFSSLPPPQQAASVTLMVSFVLETLARLSVSDRAVSLIIFRHV